MKRCGSVSKGEETLLLGGARPLGPSAEWQELGAGRGDGLEPIRSASVAICICTDESSSCTGGWRRQNSIYLLIFTDLFDSE